MSRDLPREEFMRQTMAISCRHHMFKWFGAISTEIKGNSELYNAKLWPPRKSFHFYSLFVWKTLQSNLASEENYFIGAFFTFKVSNFVTQSFHRRSWHREVSGPNRTEELISLDQEKRNQARDKAHPVSISVLSHRGNYSNMLPKYFQHRTLVYKCL